MVAEKRLKELAAEKQLLRLQCDLHRKMIGAEWGRLLSPPVSANSSHTWWTPLLPASALIAPLAGLVLARRWRGLIRGLEWGYSTWRLLRTLTSKFQAQDVVGQNSNGRG